MRDLKQQSVLITGAASGLGAATARVIAARGANLILVDRDAAADSLLEIVRRDRKWNDEAARTQLVKFFEAFGPADPLTVQGRRKLSSILFS